MPRGRSLSLVLLASAALVSFTYLTTPSIFESEDYAKLHSLNRAYLLRTVSSGHLPLWNPYVSLGRPFLADIEAAAVYPPSLLYFALGPEVGLFVLLIAHVALGLLASLALARYLGLRPLAGLLIGFGCMSSGAMFSILHSGQVQYGQAAAYLGMLPPALRKLDLLALRAAAVLAGAGVLLAWINRASSPGGAPRWLAALLLALTLGDLGVVTAIHKRFRGGYGAFPGETVVARTLADARLLTAEGPPPRIAIPYPVVRDNSGMVYGFANVSGYGALSLVTVWTTLHEELGLTPSLEANTFPSPEIYRFGPFPYRTMSLVLGFEEATGRLVRNDHPDPRSYLVHAVEVVPDLHVTIALIRGGHDPHRVALLATPPETPPEQAPPETPDRAFIERFEPNRIEIETETGARALLIVAEAWYPGWRALVNGEPAACLRANGWMRGVMVPPGRSRIALTFASTWLATGALVSLLSLALLAARLRSRPPARAGA
jgi:hypothetical protein